MDSRVLWNIKFQVCGYQKRSHLVVWCCDQKAQKQIAISNLFGLFLGLLGEKHIVDVRQNTSSSDGHVSEQLVQFLVISDGQLQVTWDDTGLLVVAGGVACEFQNLGAQVFQHGSEVHRGTTSNALGEPSLLQESVDTANRELQTSLCRARGALALLLATASFSFSRHDLSRVDEERVKCSVSDEEGRASV